MPFSIEEAKSLFDQFNQAITAGDLEKATNLRGKEQKESILAATATPEDKAGTISMLQMMTPLSYETEHFECNDKKGLLYITATFKNPEIPDQQVVQEVMLKFVDESGWKLGDITFLIDIASIKKSTDQNFEPADNYDLNRHTSIGGRIVSVQFEADYTLVVLRMLDEDDLIFLPSKADLEKSGLDTKTLVPWKILQASGSPHKSNPLKYLCTEAAVLPSNEL